MESKALCQIFDLPEEIITEIMLRLPVKSLFRFKSISQSWRSLISNKKFIKTHFQTSTKNPTFAHHMILQVTKEHSSYKVQRCHLGSSLGERRFTYATRGDSPIDKSVHSLKLAGSCNGLICILINDREFLLWNPATTESKKLPDMGGSDRVTSLGFGFVESNGDYKVFCAVSNGYGLIRKIYSLKKDSWTIIKNDHFGDHYTSYPTAGKYVSGNLHWIRTKAELNWRWYISYLDLKNEVFGIVEQPSPSEVNLEMNLGVFDGCLSVFYHSLDNGCMDYWVLKQYGVKDSWSKLMAIYVQDNDYKKDILITSYSINSTNDEVLYNYKWDIGVASYIWKEKPFWDFKTIYLDGSVISDVYVESLISIDVADVEKNN